MYGTPVILNAAIFFVNNLILYFCDIQINFRLYSKNYWLFDIDVSTTFILKSSRRVIDSRRFEKNTALEINFLLSYKMYWLFDIRRFHTFYAEVKP
jgi:hypothetical protein